MDILENTSAILIMKSILSLLFAIGFLEATAFSQQTMEIGKPFPSLTLPSMEDGSPMSVEQFRGKKLLLFVYASW